ncbi:hypothetical protein QAD02_022061 [Eretmocerus hayati]|uniref:Uncharacterized protein n=1 Tax=Eretmocerus hayati TaxID=131215 RepID=A0ACC2PS80_9HYME|nr:hypothetical protein QAD02_022061 [Eretmocerus hayati]
MRQSASITRGGAWARETKERDRDLPRYSGTSKPRSDGEMRHKMRRGPGGGGGACLPSKYRYAGASRPGAKHTSTYLPRVFRVWLKASSARFFTQAQSADIALILPHAPQLLSMDYAT